MNLEKQTFALNFNGHKKIVTVSLTEEDGIFKLADAFKKFLDSNNIGNELVEKPIIDVDTISEDISDSE